jgi:hypothetical protein
VLLPMLPVLLPMLLPLSPMPPMLVLFFRRARPVFRIWTVVLANELCTEVYAKWLFSQKINNMPLLHFYTLVSFWLFSLYFREQFRHKSFVRHYFWPYMAICSMLLLANSCWVEPVTGFNSIAKAVVQCLFIAYSVYYLFDAFGRVNFLDAADLSVGLANMGILIYNAGSLFIFMFAKILNNGLATPQSQSGIWMVNSLLYCVFQLILLFAIWIEIFRARKSSS